MVAGYGAFEESASGVRSSASTSGWPCRSAASVPTCTTRRTPTARHAPSTMFVPSTLTRRNSFQAPQSAALAARWKATSAPCAPRDSAGSSSRSPRTGSAPAAVTRSTAASERASARTVQPSPASRSIRREPMKPEPPVTNAVLT